MCVCEVPFMYLIRHYTLGSSLRLASSGLLTKHLLASMVRAVEIAATAGCSHTQGDSVVIRATLNIAAAEEFS